MWFRSLVWANRGTGCKGTLIAKRGATDQPKIERSCRLQARRVDDLWVTDTVVFEEGSTVPSNSPTSVLYLRELVRGLESEVRHATWPGLMIG